MIIDYEYKSQKLIVSYISEGGWIKMKYYHWPNPSKYIVCDHNDRDKDGRFVTWNGDSVKKIYTRYPDRYSVYDFIEELPEEEKEVLFKYVEPEIFFLDIENEILDSKPRPHLAESEIQSISIVNKNKVLVMGLDELSIDKQKSIKEDINNYFAKFNANYEFKFIKYKNEYEMLLNFFEKFVPKMPIITGWNFTEYDWVFLVNRARKIGVDPTSASLTRFLKPPSKNEGKNKKELYCEQPAHRLVIDYMELYDKWDSTIKVKEANSLDFVSENILGVKKINYEGTLKTLAKTDYKKFIFYNAVDSILVQKIHEKTKWIDILYGISTLSRIKVLDAYKTLPVTEGILRNKLKEKNVILCKIDQNIIETAEEIASKTVKGGWVKDPVKGMALWTACYDFASLYPTTMRMFNISADSYKGVLSPTKDYAIFNNHRVELEESDIILLNNTVFKNETGIVNQVMTDIYGDRKKFKGYMMKNHDIQEELKKELRALEENLILELSS
jgi:DNA polymerase elongation subunit (family B)